MPAAQQAKKTVGPTLLIGVAMLFFLYDVFLQVSPSVMVQQLMRTFDLNALALGNLSATYFYIYTIMQIPVGILYDRFGVKWLMILAMIECTVGAFIFAIAPDIYLAIFARFLMGLGSAFAFVGVLKIAATYHSGKRLAMLVGLTTALGMIGAMIANILLTQLMHGFGWRGAMTVTGILGVIITILLILSLMRFNEPKRKKEHKHKSIMPLLLHLLDSMRRRSIWMNALIAFLLYVPIAVFAELWGIPYLKQAQHFSPTASSIINSMLFFGMMIGAPAIGWCSDHLKQRKPFILGSAIAGCALLSAVIYIPDQSAVLASILFFFVGLVAGSQSLNFGMASELSPPTIAATAFAFTNLVINVGVSIFQPVVGAILDANWVGRLSALNVPIFHHNTFAIALTVLPVAYALIILLQFWLPETHGRSATHK